MGQYTKRLLILHGCLQVICIGIWLRPFERASTLGIVCFTSADWYCRSDEGYDAEERLAALSSALSAVQEQVEGQGPALGQLQAAEAELRRLLADKAGLADVQAVMQAQSAPALVPVSQCFPKTGLTTF